MKNNLSSNTVVAKISLISQLPSRPTNGRESFRPYNRISLPKSESFSIYQIKNNNHNNLRSNHIVTKIPLFSQLPNNQQSVSLGQYIHSNLIKCKFIPFSTSTKPSTWTLTLHSPKFSLIFQLPNKPTKRKYVIQAINHINLTKSKPFPFPHLKNQEPKLQHFPFPTIFSTTKQPPQVEKKKKKKLNRTHRIAIEERTGTASKPKRDERSTNHHP